MNTIRCECQLCRVYDYRHFLYDVRVAKVEIGLLFEELMKVALPTNRVVRPAGVPEHTYLRKQHALKHSCNVSNEKACVIANKADFNQIRYFKRLIVFLFFCCTDSVCFLDNSCKGHS